ncbi:MAG TPA: cupredoxin domain-containing protein [Dehalococcoidia bacterium]|nr:cupredoxin domain-containing protein [Dehalococcoidia bacterium]
MRYLLLAPVLLVTALAMACGSPSGREIQVVAAERPDGSMYYEPAQITVRPGERVVFVITNRGSQDHEFESDEAGIEEVVVPPGRTRRVGWRAPSQPGSFPAYCDLPGHREAGMELTVVVQP